MGFASDFGSRWLVAADLPDGQRLHVVIGGVRKRPVGMDQTQKWVVDFVDGTGQPVLKPLILNQGNGRILAEAFGTTPPASRSRSSRSRPRPATARRPWASGSRSITARMISMTRIRSGESPQQEVTMSDYLQKLHDKKVERAPAYVELGNAICDGLSQNIPNGWFIEEQGVMKPDAIADHYRVGSKARLLGRR
jgi:hypothetical protein